MNFPLLKIPLTWCSLLGHSSLKSVRCFPYIGGYRCLEQKKKLKPFWQQSDAPALQDCHQTLSYGYCDNVWWFWVREDHQHVAQLHLSSELVRIEYWDILVGMMKIWKPWCGLFQDSVIEMSMLDYVDAKTVLVFFIDVGRASPPKVV